MGQTVELYVLDAAELDPAAPQYLSLLTPARREAAEQYQERSAKLRLIAAGLLLHKVLGIRDDADLVFNKFGKPFLAAGGPQFSLTYAGHYAALAVAPFPVGADIEPVKETYPQILCRCFHPEELDWLHQAPCGERFYTLWTRLESALKAEGTGFCRRDRPYSLLRNSPFFFSTCTYEESIISCAAGAPFAMKINAVKADSIFGRC